MKWQPNLHAAATMAALLLMSGVSARAQITLLHEFGSGPGEGRSPTGLTLDGSTFYGTTFSGGSFNSGTVYKVNTDGSGFQVLHQFSGGAGDGRSPRMEVTVSGSSLYGLTMAGGVSNLGTVYKLDKDGVNYQMMHSFTGYATGDGDSPGAGLAIGGSTLYGVTASGGSLNAGTLFKIGTDGSGYQNLRSFIFNDQDGITPWSAMAIEGSMLYGWSRSGGAFRSGTVYRVRTDGSGYEVLHDFTGGANDGDYPLYGAPVLAGSTLYGMTVNGGDFNYGTLFKISTNGSGFQLLHEFAGGTGDGRGPNTGLTLSGTDLYGVTPSGGAYDKGTLFRVSTDGGGYEVLHHFVGGNDDGATPYGAPTIIEDKLYGTTAAGGDYGSGTLYTFAIPEPSSIALVAISAAVLMKLRRRRS